MEGECHFLEGNLRAKRWVRYTKQLLQEAGLEPERLEMFNMSSSMATAFVEAVKEMTARAKAMGPSPLKAKRGEQETLHEERPAAS
jgi:F420-non-reducing hydrogenase iron-sulfur subunit